MRSHAKASTAGSTQRQANGPGRSRFATTAALAVAIASLLALAATPASAALQRNYESSFGASPLITGENPKALAVDQSSGDVYMVDTSGDEVHRYNSAGQPSNFTAGPNAGTNSLTGFNFEPFPAHAQVAIDNSGGPSDGNVYVAEANTGQVKVFAPSGEALGSISGSGTPAGSFATNCGVAVDQANGDVYVASFENIWRYSPSGALVAESDYSGGIATIFQPCQLAVAAGNLYAQNWQEFPLGVGPLHKFATSAFATGSPPSPSSTQVSGKSTAVATDPSNGDVYVDEGNKISVLSSTGGFKYSFGSSADFGSGSAGVAVAIGGSAYVSDPTTQQVDAYGTTLEPGKRANLFSFGSPSVFTGENPRALAVDQSSGDVYVVNTSSRVRRYNSAGLPSNFTAGPDAGTNVLTGFSFEPFPGHAQVAIDNSGGPSDGNVYVAEANTGQVKVFAPSGAALGSISGSGTPAGSFATNCGVAVDQANGDVYVASFENIWRYSPSGALVAESDYSGGIATIFQPCQLAVAAGNLYAHNWQEFPLGVGPLHKFATSAFATGSPPSPASTQITGKSTAVATDPSSGDVYVDEGNKISVFSSTGGFKYSFGSSADFGSESAGVAVRAGGNAYVSDPVAHQVDVYGPFSAPPPLVETKAANNVKHVKATLNGHLDPNDSLPITGCEFEWGTDTNYTEAPISCAEGTSFTEAADVSAVLSGLTPGTTYHFRLHVTTSSGGFAGEDRSFETVPPSTVPEASTAPATALSPSSATLAGSVNPNANPLTDCRFEYVTDTALQATGFSDLSSGGSAACSPAFGSIPSDFEDHEVSATVTGLDPAQIYRFRVVAVNANGEGASDAAVIPGMPLVETTGSPTRTATTARFDSRVNPHGRQTSYRFEYVTEEQFDDSGFDSAQTTADIPMAINEVQFLLPCSGVGLALTFAGQTTAELPANPSAEQIQAALEALSAVGAGNVMVNEGAGGSFFYVTFQGALADTNVERMTATVSNPGCGQTSTAIDGGPGAEQRLVSAHVQGLAPGTTYHYRVVADSGLAGGVASGEEMTLTTRVTDAPLSHGDLAGPPGSDRAWEQVSPADTGGNPVNGPTAISSDGNRAIVRIAGGSPGSEVGTFSNQLFMERTSSGWQAKPSYPARAEATGGQWTSPSGRDDLDAIIADNFDPDKTHAFWLFGPDRQPEEVFSTFGAEYGGYYYASDDASRLVVGLNGTQDPDFPVSSSSQSPFYDTRMNLYDVSSGEAEMVSLLPGDTVPPCGVPMGFIGVRLPDATIITRQMHWVSADGAYAFFPSVVSGNCDFGSVHLYARDIEAGVTVPVAPPPVSGLDCDIRFVRTTAGSVFFATDSRLLPEDSNPSSCKQEPTTANTTDGDVYRFELESEELECVTCVVPGVAASVFDIYQQERDVIAVSDDGSRVYFQSASRLINGAANEGIYGIEVGSDELFYVGPARVFIGSNPSKGSAINSDGSVLVFRSSDPRLNPLNGPTNGFTQQYYRFDADDNSLVCLSCPLDGTPPRADVPRSIVPGSPLGSNLGPVSDDGTVAFPTSTALVGADQNTANPAQSPVAGQDVYEWRDGAVHLVSGGLRSSVGTSPELAPSVTGITPSGRDIFFGESAQLTPDAIDAYARIYTARIGGGFEFPTPPPPCPLEACQGTPRGTPEESRPGSLDFSGAGNQVQAPTRCRKGKVRRKGRCVASRKRQRARKHKQAQKRKQRAANNDRRTAR